jgi:type I restriction enzyme, S subunit
MPESVSLTSLINSIVDCEHKTAPNAPPGREFAYSIGTPNIRDGRILLETAKRVDKRTYEEWTVRSIPQEGDLILAREAPVGEVGYVGSGMRVCLGQRTVLIRPDQGKVNPRFLHYVLRSPSVQEVILAKSTGSTVAHLNVQDIRTLSVPKPPGRPRQDAVAALLGALDDKIELNSEITRTSLSLGDAHYIERITMTTCSNYSLGYLADSGKIEFGDGYRTKVDEYGQPGVPILRTAEVLNGRIESALEDFISDHYRSAIGAKLSRAGDVILTTKGTVGRVAILTSADREYAYSPQLCFFRIGPDAGFTRHYFYFWLRSREFWRQAKSMKSQTDMADYLSLRDIRMLTIAAPEGKSSRLSMEPFGALLTGISARHQESLALAELRDTLLPKLLSGELRIRDAEKVVEDVV